MLLFYIFLILLFCTLFYKHLIEMFLSFLKLLKSIKPFPKRKAKKRSVSERPDWPRPPPPSPQSMQMVQIAGSCNYRLPDTEATKGLYTSGEAMKINTESGAKLLVKEKYVGILAVQSPAVAGRLFEIDPEPTQIDQTENISYHPYFCGTGESPPIGSTGESSLVVKSEIIEADHIVADCINMEIKKGEIDNEK